jgi:hypothetical protein
VTPARLSANLLAAAHARFSALGSTAARPLFKVQILAYREGNPA